MRPFLSIRSNSETVKVKIYNNLPPHIKRLSDNPRSFELKLKKILHLHSLYSLEEYYQLNFNFV
jgi:hypothetical protein